MENKLVTTEVLKELLARVKGELNQKVNIDDISGIIDGGINELPFKSASEIINQFRHSENGTLTLKFIGDSLTAGYLSSDFNDTIDGGGEHLFDEVYTNIGEACWVNKLKRYFNYAFGTHAVVKNYGAVGATTEGWIQHPELVTEEDDVVVVMLGYNDFWQGASYTDVRNNLSTICQHIWSVGAEPIIMTSPFLDNNEFGFQISDVCNSVAYDLGITIVHLGERLQEYCDTHGLNYNDLTVDGTHFNDRGNNVIYLLVAELFGIGLSTHSNYRPKLNWDTPTVEEVMSRFLFPKNPITLKFIGDSLTAGDGSSDYDVTAGGGGDNIVADIYANKGMACWCNRLGKYFYDGMSNNNIVKNFGISGAQAEDFVRNKDTIITEDDNVVVIMLGYNDLGHGKSDEELMESLMTLCGHVLDFGNQPILMTSPMVEDMYRGYRISNCCNKVGALLSLPVIRLGERIQTYCDDNGITYNELTVDNLHFSDKGNLVVYELICELMGIGMSNDAYYRPRITWNDDFNIRMYDMDDNGIYTKVNYERPNGTVYMSSILHQPDDIGRYTKCTWIYFLVDGVTEKYNEVWTITYNSDDVIESIVKG